MQHVVLVQAPKPKSLFWSSYSVDDKYIVKLEMWADAQRDGRPAMWRRL